MKRVLVLQTRHLLADGVLSLLNRELDLHIFESTFSDAVNLLKEIKKIKASVLVMDESASFSDPSRIFSLLNGCPDLRVIVIDERKNRMHIYEKQEIEVGHFADLVAAIGRGEQLLY